MFMSFFNSKVPKGYLFSDLELRNLVIPLILEQLLGVTVGMLDSIMVSYAGEAAVSGVSLVDSIFVLFQQSMAALCAGGAVVAGQYLGMDKRDKACSSVNQLLIFTVSFGFLIMTGLYAGQQFLLGTVFGKITPDVYSCADIYLLITAASVPFMAFFLGAFAIFRAEGDTKLSLRISIVMNVINLAGNAVLVYGLKLGTAGVAIPTLVSRAAGALLCLCFLLKQKRTLHIALPFRFEVQRKMLFNILYIGVPNGFESFMFNFGKVILLSLVAGFGTASIAANAIGNNLGLYQVLPGTAISLAMVTVVSRCVGAADFKQARFYTRRLLKMSYFYCAVSTGLVFFLTFPVLRIYSVSAEATKLAFWIMAIHGTGTLFTYTPSFVLPNTLRASNDVRYCFVISSISMWLARVGGGYLFARGFGMGVIGVWTAMQFDWIFRSFFFIRRYRGDKWQSVRLS